MKIVILSLVFSCVCTVTLYTIDGDENPKATNVELKYSNREKRQSDNTSSVGDSSDNICVTDSNFTNCTIVEDHKYYKAHYIADNSLWIELNPEENSDINATQHDKLSYSSNKHGYAETLTMDDFLFYGLPIKNITILTGGFLHVGEIRYAQYLTKIQYIAPFMGNFNPNLSSSSNVFYFSNETMFITQWDKMMVDQREELGNFTFQVQLYKENYDIVFAYKEMPVTDLTEEEHPNSAGISDAYYIMNPNNVFLHIYHELDINKTRLGNGTAIKLVHQKLCPMIKDCYNCTTETLQDFECRWCSKSQQCSDKVGDSAYNDWHAHICSITYKKAGDKCDEYCYYPDPGTANTTYTPPRPDLYPVMLANSTGPPKVQIDCSSGYSVSNNYELTGSDHYECKSGGMELPHCAKSCNYTTRPAHGNLTGATPGYMIKPDAEFSITCDANHRIKNNVSQTVRCIDNGTLEPDPANIKCYRFCTLPHPANARYFPSPQDSGYLHEGESTTLVCDENHALDDYLTGEYPDKTVPVSCEEDTDLSSFAEKCVGVCSIAPHPNTTYTPALPKVDDDIAITCSNGTSISILKSYALSYKCVRAGPLTLPICAPVVAEKTSEGGSNSLTILLVLFTLSVVAIISGWVFYAYRHPTSPSGLFLIEKCRPWTWRSHTYRRHEESLGESYYLDGGI